MIVATREDVRRAAGRALVCGFPGIEVTAEARELLRETRPAGVILFGRNIESPEQVAALCRELKALQPQLLVCVDQEGGAELRIRATEWPAMRTVGRAGDVTLAERFGRGLGGELQALGIDVTFAPVLDVDTNPENPIIGPRSLSPEPKVVAELGSAIVRGLHAAGIAAVGKHFPGHGDTSEDSHETLPHLSHDLDRFRAVEWPPFAAALQAGLGAIMTAHVVVEALDETTPATLSRAALAPLRNELGFGGVLFSDGAEMRALDGYSPEQIAVQALNATVDVLLPCHEPELVLALYRGIVVGCEQQTISHETLLAAEARLLAWRSRFAAAPPPEEAWRSQVGCAEHQELADQICERAERG